MNEENYEIFGNYVIVESVKRMRRARKGIIHYCRIIEKHPDDDLVGDWYYNIINFASLHNLLYQEVTGERYDYMFHWANKAGFNGVIDNMFDHVFEQESEEEE